MPILLKPENCWGMSQSGALSGGLRLRLSGIGRIYSEKYIKLLNARHQLSKIYEFVENNDPETFLSLA
jgi:hypothetical protein